MLSVNILLLGSVSVVCFLHLFDEFTCFTHLIVKLGFGMSYLLHVRTENIKFKYTGLNSTLTNFCFKHVTIYIDDWNHNLPIYLFILFKIYIVFIAVK